MEPLRTGCAELHGLRLRVARECGTHAKPVMAGGFGTRGLERANQRTKSARPLSLRRRIDGRFGAQK